MVDKKVDLPGALADLQQFVDINMPKIGTDIPKIAVMEMAVGMKEHATDDEDDYVKGVMVGLWLAHLVIEYCERKVN